MNQELLYIGRLDNDSGFMQYLEITRLLSKIYNVKLIVCGNGTEMDKAKKFVKKHRLNVIFKGFVYDLEPYYKEYEIIFTTGYLGILEGMAHKMLVVSYYDIKIKEDYLKGSPFYKYIIASDNIKKLVKEILDYWKKRESTLVLVKKR